MLPLIELVGESEARIAMAEGILERLVKHCGANVEEGLHGLGLSKLHRNIQSLEDLAMN